MEPNHLHLLVNHVPILGTFFGLALFVFGLLKKNSTLEKAGLITFLIAAFGGAIAYFSGDDAEHVVEHVQGASESMIHKHEELAEAALYLMTALALVSMVLLMALRRQNPRAGMLKIVVLILALATFGCMSLVGYSGGKIRRPELRTEMDNQMTVDDDDDDETHLR